MTAPLPYCVTRVGQDELSLLKDGAQAFPAMLGAIASARSTICLETYILRDDATGRRFAAALAERARAGVEVSVLYDDWGSSVSEEFLAELHHAGVRTAAFAPAVLWSGLEKFVAKLRRRDHRKALIIDGEVAFTGGLNIGDDYAAARDGGGNWRDTHLRVQGPTAAALQDMFFRTWHVTRGAKLSLERYPASSQRTDGSVRVVGADFRAEKRRIKELYVEAIRSAKDRVLITNAYFLPTLVVMRALTTAARKRGVEVKIILAGTTDVTPVLYAARAIYGLLLRAGVRIFEFRGRVLHAKTATIDGEWSTVGSSNLDALSLLHNLEVNVVVRDRAFAAAMERLFEEDLQSCVEITKAEWANRGPLERLLSYVFFGFRRWL